jgi:hypothetical protein
MPYHGHRMHHACGINDTACILKNSNIFANSNLYSKRLLPLNQEPRTDVLMKKNRGSKISWHCPFKLVVLNNCLLWPKSCYIYLEKIEASTFVMSIMANFFRIKSLAHYLLLTRPLPPSLAHYLPSRKDLWQVLPCSLPFWLTGRSLCTLVTLLFPYIVWVFSIARCNFDCFFCQFFMV